MLKSYTFQDIYSFCRSWCSHQILRHKKWIPYVISLGLLKAEGRYPSELSRRYEEHFVSRLVYTEHKHWTGPLDCWFFDTPLMIPLTFFPFQSYFELVGNAGEAHLPRSRDDKNLKRYKHMDDAVNTSFV